MKGLYLRTSLTLHEHINRAAMVIRKMGGLREREGKKWPGQKQLKRCANKNIRYAELRFELLGDALLNERRIFINGETSNAEF